MLILFDIDLTLVRAKGLGLACMQRALENMYGRPMSFEGIEFAGRLDPLIWSDAVRRNQLEDSEEAHRLFRSMYGREMARALGDGATVDALPGAAALVQATRAIEGVTIGLLTGNYMETGRLKVEAAGIDPDWFPVCAWGADGESRRDLPPVAIDAYARHVGSPIDPGQVTILGDTVHDVDCAKANGCRSLATATGMYSFGSLDEAGADLVVRDLTDTDAIIGWILDGRLEHAQ